MWRQIKEFWGFKSNVEVPRVKHKWTLVEFLYEPGISDVDNGRWSRKKIRCVNCLEERAVWVGLVLEDPILTTECPDSRCKSTWVVDG